MATLKNTLIKIAEMYKNGELNYGAREVYKETINNRLTVYAAGPGTGKTNMAMGVADYTMYMNSDTKSEDLVQSFAFEDGQPTFKNSMLVHAIINDKVIVLSDIQELKDEAALRMIDFISTTDEINGVKIPDNFKMICTFTPIIYDKWYCDIM